MPKALHTHHGIPVDVLAFFRKNAVVCIAFLAALVTTFFVPVDAEYLGYFDFKTLTCLFCVLAVVCALKNIRFFYLLARKIVQIFKNARMSVLGLVYITFIGSMLIGPSDAYPELPGPGHRPNQSAHTDAP